MPSPSQPTIFLSYASEDRPTILGLYDRLKQQGYSPWMDERSLIGGQNWQEIIPTAIKDSSLFVACLSRHSVVKQGYIQKEYRMALTKSAQNPPETIYLIPLRLDDCDIPDLSHSEYGLNLRHYQRVDYFEKDGFERLVNAIQHQFPHCAPAPADTEKPRYFTFEFECIKVNSRGSELERCQQQAKYYREDLGGVSLDMVVIPDGTFQMGSHRDEYGHSAAETPLHSVNVSSFMMSKHPLTQAQWQAIALLPKVNIDLEANPSIFRGPLYPVVHVSWHDAQEFCARLSNYTGRSYRLPSEAEWEYACRAGSITPFHFGDTTTQDTANCASYEGGTTSVCKYLPNSFGLYDMHGNIFEWCQDNWHDSYEDAPSDGSVWLGGSVSDRVSRGGSTKNNACYCRSASRHRHKATFRDRNLGMRLCCSTFSIQS